MISLPATGSKNQQEAGRKNKREDRGSIEEETNAAKRSNKELNGQEEASGNMADKDEESDAEPTLYDIRNMRIFKNVSRASLRKTPS